MIGSSSYVYSLVIISKSHENTKPYNMLVCLSILSHFPNLSVAFGTEQIDRSRPK